MRGWPCELHYRGRNLTPPGERPQARAALRHRRQPPFTSDSVSAAPARAGWRPRQAGSGGLTLLLRGLPGPFGGTQGRTLENEVARPKSGQGLHRRHLPALLAQRVQVAPDERRAVLTRLSDELRTLRGYSSPEVDVSDLVLPRSHLLPPLAAANRRWED